MFRNKAAKAHFQGYTLVSYIFRYRTIKSNLLQQQYDILFRRKFSVLTLQRKIPWVQYKENEILFRIQFYRTYPKLIGSDVVKQLQKYLQDASLTAASAGFICIAWAKF